MSTEKNETGKTYAEIWGEAIHSNRHLRVLTMGLGGIILLLVVIVIQLSSVEAPRPIVVRVDEVGRAEALAYEAVEAQADPLDPTTKYFLNRFIDDYYSRRRATVEQSGPACQAFRHAVQHRLIRVPSNTPVAVRRALRLQSAIPASPAISVVLQRRVAHPAGDLPPI